MRKFFAYFFGQGETAEFKYFSLAHILPILILGGVIALIIVYRAKIRKLKHEEKLRITMAFICIITEMSYFWRMCGVEALTPTPVDHLPITVCGWGIIFCTFLCLTKNQTLFDIAYFWVLTGSIFGIATPTVIEFCGPTRFRFYQFWLEHTMGFVVLFYMMFVHKMRPNVKSIFKSYGMLLILGVIAIIANNIIPGANYLFMAKPEDTPSILDILPKNYAVRIIIMASVMALLFFIAYLPWLIKDIRVKKKVHILATSKSRTTTEFSYLDSEMEESNIEQQKISNDIPTQKESIQKKTTTKKKTSHTSPKSTKTATAKKKNTSNSSK
ncbi:MAG: TIGR02206 family membrane protein [Clostridia bacterium]|nr:TIGR02206 family membrane protein [Clostridia bacterium]